MSTVSTKLRADALPSHHSGGFEGDVERIEARALLLDIHDNCVRIVERAVQILLILGEAGPSSYGYAKAADLKGLVLDPLREGKYDEAWSGIIGFIDDATMYRIMRLLIDHAEPGVLLLAKAAQYYNLR